MVRGCPCTLERIVLDPREPSFSEDPRLPPHILQYAPLGAILLDILRAPGLATLAVGVPQTPPEYAHGNTYHPAATRV